MESNKNILEELILDESFQNYVIHHKEEGKWQHWLEQHPSNKQDFEEAVVLVKRLKFQTTEISDLEINKEIDRFNHRIVEESNTIPMWKRFMRIAAVIVLAVAVTFVCYDYFSIPTSKVPVAQSKMIEKKTPIGAKSQIKLPDGTLVKLNSGSMIKYPSIFDGDLRSVELNGEAYFEVVKIKSKPFVVNTANMKTTVLGTSFSIKSYDERETNISLLEGSVLVNAYGEEKILKPGQKLSLIKNTIEIEDYDFNEDFGWKEGILYFNDASAKEVFDKLKLWYGAEFSFGSIDLPRLKYSGFYKNQDLETVLNGLGYSLKFDYEINEKNVNIKFN